MKMIIGTLVTLISIGISGGASASAPGWHAASDGAAVAKAVTDAINWTTIKCTGTVTENGKTSSSDLDADVVKSVIPAAQTVLLKDDASQPLIKFEITADDAEKQHFETSIIVTTTADRKTVVKLDLSQKITAQQVENIGTLDQPVSQTVTVVVQDTRGTCQ